MVAWADASFPKRMEILVQSANIDANVASFPALIKLTDTEAIVNADMISKRYRIFDHNGTECDYDQESYVEGGTYVNFETWCEIADLYASPAGDQNKVWLYYGNYDPGGDQDDSTGTWDVSNSAVYHMNGTADSTSNAHTLTDSGTADAAGKIARARDFVQSESDFMYVANHADFNMGTGDFTIEAWFNIGSSPGSGHPIIMKGDTDGAWYVLGFDPTDYLRAFVDDSSNTAKANDTNNYMDGAWHHAAGVLDGNTLRIYVDGGEVDTGDATSVGDLDDAARRFYIGGRYRTGAGAEDQFFEDQIDEVRITKGLARSAAWIKFEHRNVNEADNELTWGGEENYLRPGPYAYGYPMHGAFAQAWR